MMTALDFVQSLQPMKKVRDQWLALELTERSRALQKIADKLRQNERQMAEQLAQAQGLPVEFVLENEIRASIQFLTGVSQMTIPKGIYPKPTGLISVLLPEFFAFRILAERLAPALLAGNGLFVYFPRQTSVVEKLWQQLLEDALPVRLFTGGEDLEQIMAAHPAIHAVSFYGFPERAQKIYQQIPAGNWKKWQITSGFHNSALILNDVDLSKVARQLAESCFLGMGQLHWNISTIYVTESMRPQFEVEFLSEISKLPHYAMSESALQKNEKLIGQFKSENGKILYGGQVGEPLVVEDLSHCSTLQQDCLAAPIVLISPVKYIHEMVKWANTSYYGMSAQIFGPEEKIPKFASQLEVSRITANSWVNSMASLPLGLKQSFFGISNLDPFGEFFSDPRKIDGV